MPLGALVQIGWIVEPPALYHGAEVELLQVKGADVWALRIRRDDETELLFFPDSESLERHLRPTPDAPELFVSSARPKPRDG